MTTTPHHDFAHPFLGPGLLALLLAGVYLTGLFTDVTGDAALYASISKELVQTGSVIDITRHGEPYLQKPPLLFWLNALSFSLLGVSNAAFKLPTLLFSLVGLFALYRLGVLYYDRRVGVTAAVLLGTSFALIMYTNDIHHDTLLAALLAFSVWQLALFLEGGGRWHLVWGFVGIGLAMLTKGPVGMAIPAFAVGTHLLLRRDWRQILRWEWLLGVVVAGLVLIPGLLGLYRQFGLEGLEFFFWRNNVGRITGSLYQNNTDPLFYLHSLLWVFLPWALLALAALGSRLITLARAGLRLSEGEEGLSLGGFFVYVLIGSAASYKAPHYLVEVLPFLALLTAAWLVRLLDSEGRVVAGRVVLGVQVLIAALVWGFTGFLMSVGDRVPPVVWVIVLGLLASNLTIPRLMASRLARSLAVAIPPMLALGYVLNLHLFPLFFQYNGHVAMARTLNAVHQPGDSLYVYGLSKGYNGDIDFYSDLWAHYLGTDADLEAVLARPEGGWLFVTESAWDALATRHPELEATYTFAHASLLRPPKLIKAIRRGEPLEQRRLIRLEGVAAPPPG